jgi:NADH dehydrogenase [ubiquinone] 1 alpha subcomplex assembly factor 1
MLQSMTLFDFSKDSNLSNWRILDDVVMGGRSNGIFKLNEDNHGEFSGKISLENNGGFSSVRYYFEKIEPHRSPNLLSELKGMGKNTNLELRTTETDGTPIFLNLPPMVTGKLLKFHFLKCIHHLEVTR